MLKSYLKIGWRNLTRNKGYSFINIGGLALGMAVALLIGLWIYDELSFNRYHEHYDTIGQVYRKDTWDGVMQTNAIQVTGLGSLLRSEYSTHFKRTVLVRGRIEERVISHKDDKFTQLGYFMQPEGPAMFSLKMIHGTLTGLENMQSVMISASLAKKIFGNTDPINQMVTMDAKWDLKVTGVYEDLPKNSEFYEASYLAPLDLYLDGWSNLNIWDNYNMNLYVQMHTAGDFEKVSAIIKDSILPHVNEERARAKPEIFLLPMRKWRLAAHFENGVQVSSPRMKIVWLYGTIGAFVLLLACINFMNLSTARSEKRAKEVGIRKAIGSYRRQLVYQFFGESLLVAALSFLVALVIAQLAMPAFNAIADKNISLPLDSPLFWAACISFTVLTGMLAGSYPALYLSSFHPVKVLKGTFKTGRLAAMPRKVLVIIQFTVSVILMAGTLIVYQQVQFAKNRPVGYSREGLVSVHSRSAEFKSKFEVLRNEFKKTGLVIEAAQANYSVTSTLGWNVGFEWKGKNNTMEGPSFNINEVTHEYGKAIGWEFTEGRDFSRDFESDLSGVVINETARKLMGLERPVGELLIRNRGEGKQQVYSILGVIRDVVKGSPFEPTDPCLYFLSTRGMEWLYVRISPVVSTHDALPKLDAIFKEIVPSAPFDYKFADAEYSTKFRAEERIGALASLFSALAILISCSGLSGLASFVAEQRTKEIGIRKVLGATTRQLWQLLSAEFIILTTISCLIAIPITYYALGQWLEQYQYRVTINWWMFVAIAAGALIITLATVSIQSLKAALANPVTSLRSE